MAKMSLHNAKNAKQDEFYTQLSDIENELKHYRKHFEGAVVLCNCDDPDWSNFWKYFYLNFEVLGLKKLISTHYDTENSTYKMEYNGTGEPIITNLEGNGDFRSPECIELLKEASIVVTNPPFSLFREYMATLIEHDKKFLIIGNQNNVSTKEIFPLFMANKVWLGYKAGDMSFRVPDYYEPRETRYWVDENGQKWRSLGNICWYTNIDHSKRHEELILYKNYSPEEYVFYDNYDAIEISKITDIPVDFDGVMGVPVTFLDKYNPDQFEMLGCTQRGCHDLVPDTKKYDDYWEMKQDGTRTKSSGGKTNENPNIAQNDGKHNYFINAEGHIVQAKFSRIFIKRKKG